jgi:hypothetical protein
MACLSLQQQGGMYSKHSMHSSQRLGGNTGVKAEALQETRVRLYAHAES